MKRIATIAAAGLMSGCVATSGVMKLGPDTYSVVTSDRGVNAGATTNKKALEDATAKCESEGKQILVANRSSSAAGLDVTTSVTFHCLDEGDPDLRRPVYVDVPDTVIEDRRN